MLKNVHINATKILLSIDLIAYWKIFEMNIVMEALIVFNDFEIETLYLLPISNSKFAHDINIMWVNNRKNTAVLINLRQSSKSLQRLIGQHHIYKIFSMRRQYW